MADIKLTYFNVRGRAELSRLILAYAGVQYTDERLSSIESMKPSLPYGQVPVLNYNGEILGQSLAIARFLANEFNLAGKTGLQRAQADEIVDTLSDILVGAAKLFFMKDAVAKKAEEAKFGESSTKSFGQLEARLKSRGGQFFVGNNVTWADIMLFCAVDGLKAGMPTILDNFPLQKDLVQRVGELPNIKKWVKSRPVTNM